MRGDAVLLTLPVLLPLMGAAAAFFLGRFPTAARILGLVVLVAVVVDAAFLLAQVDGGGPITVQAGGWQAPLGITLVADRLAALALLASSIVFLAVFLFAIGQGLGEQRAENVPSVFHPMYLTLATGISLAFLTGDLFNLYVALEVLLTSSYVLLTMGATGERVRAGMTYVVTSLCASLLLLTTVSLVYATTGTLNLADLAVQMQTVPPGVRTVLSLMLLLAIGVKAAIVPLHLWLPDSYPTAPAPVTAVFAALLTKVGVYAIVRIQTLVFPREDAWTLLLVLAAATMLVGALGALAQHNLHRMLSFALVSHVGFLLLGLALFSVAGLAGTIVYLVHHITVQASLFLVTGLVERERGTVSLRCLGGLALTSPALSLLFVFPALSLSGVPPFAGFVGKIGLLQAAIADGGVPAYALTAVALLASLLTLAAMARVWVSAFWRPPEPRVADQDPEDLVTVATGRPARLMGTATATAVVAGLVVAAAAGPLSAIAARAAEDLVARNPYVQSVLGPGVSVERVGGE